jgi:putative sterol carrier protein
MAPTGAYRREQIREALDDYVEQANANERVRRTLRNWRCSIQFEALDSDAAFTLNIDHGEITSAEDGLRGEADLIIQGSGEDLTEIFWGEANPAERYNKGAVTVRGSQEHLMRLDALAMFIYLGA